MRIALDLPPGLVTDDTQGASKGRWRDADKVWFVDGKPQVFGGWEALTLDVASGVVRNAYSWVNNNGVRNIALGSHTHLEVILDGVITDITPVGLTAGLIDGKGGLGYGTGEYGEGEYGEATTGQFFPRTWSLQQFGETLLACPRGGTIYQWQNNLATPAAGLTNAPAAVNTFVVTDERIVLALGCTDTSGTYGPMVVRNTGPQTPTVWTPSATNIADEQVLQGGSRLVGGISGSYGTFIWSDNCLFFAVYEGSEARAFRIDRTGEGCGLIGPNAATVVGQTAYWVSNVGQFWSCVANGAPQELACPIRDDFFENIATNQEDKIVCAKVTERNAVIWFYPDARDGDENSRYLALNTLDGSWTRGTFDRTAFVGSGNGLPFPCGVDYAGNVYFHERGQSANGDAITAYVETSFMALGDGERWTFLKGVWPDFQGQVGSVSLTVTAVPYLQGDETVFGPFSMAANDPKTDFRASGRFMRFKFSSSRAPTAWRLGAPAFEAQPMGRR